MKIEELQDFLNDNFMIENGKLLWTGEKYAPARCSSKLNSKFIEIMLKPKTSYKKDKKSGGKN